LFLNGFGNRAIDEDGHARDDTVGPQPAAHPMRTQVAEHEIEQAEVGGCSPMAS
jgi:hypothetical protein